MAVATLPHLGVTPSIRALAHTIGREFCLYRKFCTPQARILEKILKYVFVENSSEVRLKLGGGAFRAPKNLWEATTTPR